MAWGQPSNVGTSVGNMTALLSLGFLALVLALWLRSFNGVDSFNVDGPGSSQFQFMSRQGRLMFGVFEAEQRRRAYWLPPHQGLADLVLDEDRFFVADFWGWGIAVPHLLLSGLAAVPLLWWIFVFRHRGEALRRAQLGLCHECGYDLRYANERCPECGTRIGVTELLIAPPPGQ